MNLRQLSINQGNHVFFLQEAIERSKQELSIPDNAIEKLKGTIAIKEDSTHVNKLPVECIGTAKTGNYLLTYMLILVHRNLLPSWRSCSYKNAITDSLTRLFFIVIDKSIKHIFFG